MVPNLYKSLTGSSLLYWYYTHQGDFFEKATERGEGDLEKDIHFFMCAQAKEEKRNHSARAGNVTESPIGSQSRYRTRIASARYDGDVNLTELLLHSAKRLVLILRG